MKDPLSLKRCETIGRGPRKGQPRIRRHRGSGSIEHGYNIVERDGVRKRAHVWLVEQVLGKELPPAAIVHHINEDKLDNRHENLVVCPDQAYHMLLHRRMAAFEATGHHDWLRCSFCKSYDAPERITVQKRRGRVASDATFHADCARKDALARYYRGQKGRC
jgi:hypothetical protein